MQPPYEHIQSTYVYKVAGTDMYVGALRVQTPSERFCALFRCSLDGSQLVYDADGYVTGYLCELETEKEVPELLYDARFWFDENMELINIETTSMFSSGIEVWELAPSMKFKGWALN